METTSLRNLRTLASQMRAEGYDQCARMVRHIADGRLTILEGKTFHRLRREREFALAGALIVVREHGAHDVLNIRFTDNLERTEEVWAELRGAVVRHVSRTTTCLEEWVTRSRPKDVMAAALCCDDEIAGGYQRFLLRHRRYTLAQSIGFLASAVWDVEEDDRGERLRVVKGSPSKGAQSLHTVGQLSLVREVPPAHKGGLHE